MLGGGSAILKARSDRHVLALFLCAVDVFAEMFEDNMLVYIDKK